MATTNLRGSELQVVYVDVDSVSGANTGLTPDDALQAFPDVTAVSGDSLYLIRRTDTVIDYTKDDTTASNVVFMGMPTSGADYYSSVPAEAITAWGSDVAEGVSLRGNATNVSWDFQGSNSAIYNMTLLSRNTNDLTVGHVEINSKNFYMKDSTIKVEGMPLSAGPDQFDFSNVEHVCVAVGNNNSAGTTFENCVFQSYDDNAIEFSPDADGHNNVSIIDCDIYFQNNGFASIYGIYMPSICRNCVISGTTVTHRASDVTDGGTPYAIFMAQMYDCLLNDLIINFTVAMNSSSLKRGISHSSTSYRSVLKDITINMSPTQYMRGIDLNNHSKVKVENVTVNMNNMSGTSAQEYGIYMSNCDNSVVENCVVNMNSDLSHSGTAFYGLNSEGTCVRNSEFNSGGTAINSSGVSFYDTKAVGQVKGNNPFIHLTNFDNEASILTPWYENDLIDSLLYAESCSLSASSQSTPEVDTNGLVIIESVPGASLLHTPNGDFGAVYVNNEFIDNLWHHETENNTMFSTSAERVSGGGISTPVDQTGYSIKCTGQSDSGGVKSRAAVIAPRPFNGIPLSFTGTGKKRVTLYFSGRLQAPTYDSIWFDLEIPDGAVGSSVKTVSTFGYDLSDGTNDTSVWEGDTSLISYKVDLEFTLDRDEVVYGRIYYDQVTSIGHFYLDPVLVTEDL